MKVLGALLFNQWVEVTILWKHDQVDLGVCSAGGARSPAEVEQLIFGVEVDVARCGLWRDLAAVEFAASGFERDERSFGHDLCSVLMLFRCVVSCLMKVMR